MAETITLRPVRKFDALSHRMVDPAMTVQAADQLRARFGITRVADITGLDTLGIPVVSVVRPSSKMAFTVHSGKGVSYDAAMASGLMEGIEVSVAETAERRLPQRQASAGQLLRERAVFLHPRDVFFRIPLKSYTDNAELPWIEGYDLIREEPVWVPLEFVNLGENQYGKILPPGTVDTHGLASGNVIEEAIFHGLSEIIERDACLLTVFLAAELGWTDKIPGRPVLIDLPSLPPVCAHLANKIQAAGLQLYLMDLTMEFDVPVVRALIRETVLPRLGRRHPNAAFVWYCGSGASVNSEVAIVRAITEAAQSRAVHIQGAREDLDISESTHRASCSDDDKHYLFQAKKKIAISWMWYKNFRRLLLDPEAQPKPFAAMKSYVAEDVSLDIRFILRKLRQHGFDRAIVVDLSMPDTGLSVVKVIVPGLAFCVQSIAYAPRFYRLIL